MKINEMSEFITTILILFVTLAPITMVTSDDCLNSNCHDSEMCVNNTCVHACSVQTIPMVKNAVCTAYDHIPHWDCQAGYSGHPYYACTKSCTKHEDCADAYVCMTEKCLFGCGLERCKFAEHCETINHEIYCRQGVNQHRRVQIHN